MFVLVEGGSHHNANSIGQAQYRAALSQLFRMKEPPTETALQGGEAPVPPAALPPTPTPAETTALRPHQPAPAI